MSILRFDFELAQRQADTFAVKRDFARKVEQACDLLAAMEAQQQALDQLLVGSRNRIQESRALLRELDDAPGADFVAEFAL